MLIQGQSEWSGRVETPRPEECHTAAWIPWGKQSTDFTAKQGTIPQANMKYEQFWGGLQR